MATKRWYAVVWPRGIMAYTTEVGKPTAWQFTTEAARDEFVAGGPPSRRDNGYRQIITGADVRKHGLHPVPAEEMDSMAELKSWVAPARHEAAATGIGRFVWFLTLDGKHIAQGLAPTEEAARRAVMDARDEFIAAECDEIDCRSIPL